MVIREPDTLCWTNKMMMDEHNGLRNTMDTKNGLKKYDG